MMMMQDNTSKNHHCHISAIVEEGAEYYTNTDNEEIQ